MATLRGYAVVTDSLSEDLGFRERISPKAVDAALAQEMDRFALADHDYTKVLGRESAGTLRLERDKVGLLAEIDVPESYIGKAVEVSVGRGDTRGMSFSFSVPEGGDDWELEGDQLLRTVNAMTVYEVSVTARPAYPQTSIQVVERSVDKEAPVVKQAAVVVGGGIEVDSRGRVVDRAELAARGRAIAEAKRKAQESRSTETAPETTPEPEPEPGVPNEVNEARLALDAR